MIASHFESIGFNCTYSNDYDEFESSTDSYDLNVCYIDEAVELSNRFTGKSNPTASGLVVTPLTQSGQHRIWRDWPEISSPVSNKQILDSLRTLGISEKASSSSRSSSLQNHPTGLHVLVAEDVEVNQRIAKEMLGILGYEVTIVSDGVEAVRANSDHGYDVILMDCQMPNMDGFEATVAIRKMESEQGKTQTPIIALTAGITKNDESRCTSVGMNDYVTKPFSLGQIRETIAKHVATPRRGVVSGDLPDFSPSNTQNTCFENAEIINEAAIKNIQEVEKQTGSELLIQVFDGFVDQIKPKLSELSMTINDQNFKELYRTAHAIKSMSANIGAERVRLIAAAIESAEKAGDRERTKLLYPQLVEANDEFQKEMLHSKYLT